MKRIIVTTLIATISLATPALAEPDWQAVGEALGKEGTVQPDGIYRVGLPRSDLKVQLDGVEIKPALALGTWLAFQPVGDTEAMVMGDLVLMQDEVNPVLSELLDAGLEVTALHNHFFFDDPKVYFMHVAGEGALAAVAQRVRNAVDKVKELRAKGAPAPGSGTR